MAKISLLFSSTLYLFMNYVKPTLQVLPLG